MATMVHAQDPDLIKNEQTIAKTVPDETGPLPMIHGDFRDMQMTASKVRVTDIIDGVTIKLDNESKVRLSGLWVPWDTGADPGENVQKAVALLKKTAYGRYVRIYQSRKDEGRSNRMGDVLAQVERDDGMWLQGALLYAGLAFVMTAPANPEQAKRMYDVEIDARKRKAGLWGNPRWDVLRPDQAAAFANEFRIVEGRVYSTAMRNNSFYLNFDRDWKTDFTVMIDSGQRIAFAKAGMDMQKLNGKKVRVRGWIRNYNGPMLEVTHPQAIEVLE